MREEQNFISANEIDNMVLIMPTATRRSAVVSEGGPAGGGSKVGWHWHVIKCQILDVQTFLFMDSIMACFVPKVESVLPHLCPGY